jgi:periplasmic protein TonB
MTITGLHWLIATVIAVSIHLAGMAWLFLASPSRPPDVETAGEGIVVTLGQGAENVVDYADAPEPDAGRDVTATQQIETELPDMEPEPPEPEVAAGDDPVPDPAAAEPATIEPAAVDPAQSVEPDPVVEPDASRPKTMEPAAAEPGRPAEPAIEESPASAADVVADSPPVPSASADVARAPSPPERPADAVEAQDASVAVDMDMEEAASPSVALRAELTDDDPVAEPAPPTTVRAAETVNAGDAPVAEVPAVDEPQAGPTVDDAPASAADTVPADSAVPRTAQPETSGDTDVEVAVAREAAPDTQQMFEPEFAEPAVPETIDLQELQERAGGTGVVAHYAGELKGWLERNMHYPRAARLAGQEGDAVVRFVIDRDGNVQSVELEAGSGFPLLDREAVEMVERGDPFPAMPQDMPGALLEVRVPVSFHVRDETRTRDLPPIYLE